MLDNLTDRTVLITGATGGLGSAVVREFALSEARLALTSRSTKEMERLRAEVGLAPERALIVAADVTQASEVEDLVAAVLARFGRLDVLLNTVGGWSGGKRVDETPVENWEKMMALNLRSAFLLSRAVLPPMLEAGWGRIVHVSSRGAVKPSARQVGYAVSKMGVITLTEVLAAETRGTGVTANVILSGTIDTEDNREMMPKADFGKWVPPRRMAAAMRFLCSEEAASINGARLAIYGDS
jgi:NAD(P)-dependent dehydrogenase (short-subunit alcohol dehydrogenase family)